MRKTAHVERHVLLYIFLSFVLGGSLWADPVEVAPADWTGMRTTPGPGTYTPDGVKGSGTWSEFNAGFRISWQITQTDSGRYHYEYTFSGESGVDFSLGRAMSHWIVQTSDFITEDNWQLYIYDIEGPLADAEFGNEWSGSAGNPGLVNSLHGLKFNWDGSTGDDAQTWSFMSTQKPVWGDFYSKDGPSDVWAQNMGLYNNTDPDENTTDFTYWVPVVDTEPGKIIPEPASALLVLVGVVCCMLGRHRRHRRLTVRAA
jgi:hypothetical protein